VGKDIVELDYVEIRKNTPKPLGKSHLHANATPQFVLGMDGA
jgi:hypothetical protein